MGNPSSYVLCLFERPYHSWSTFLHSGTKCSGSSCVFSVQSRYQGSMTLCYGGVITSSAPQQKELKNKCMYMHIHTHTHPHTHLYLCTYFFYMNINHEITSRPWIIIKHHRVNFRLVHFPCSQLHSITWLPL